MRNKALALWLVALTAIMPVAGDATEHYDFELTSQACANAVGDAHVDLTARGGTLTFSGTVVCDGAASVTISQLRIVPLAPPGAAVETSRASCGPCGPDPLKASGDAPEAPGAYAVRMLFTAVSPTTGRAYTATREAQFLVTSTPLRGPIRYCQTPRREYGAPAGVAAALPPCPAVR